MSVRPEFIIDLSAVVHNYRRLQRVNPHTEIAGVVKDNAYGLGATQVAEALYTQAGCRTFFVAYGFEGLAIRPYVSKARIYVLQGFGADEVDAFQQADLIPVLSSPTQLKLWHALKPNTQKPAIQIETGLNRLGFTETDILNLSDEQRSQFSLVLSHLACADEADSVHNQHQLGRFNHLKSFFNNAAFSLSASDGYALGKAFHFDIIRAGAFLYGINTFPALKNEQRAVVAVRACIIQTKRLKDGDYVGYGASFKADNNTKIAIVSIGYGDGLPRCFSKTGKVWFQTTDGCISAPVAGRVSMDNLIIDVTHIPDNVLNQSDTVWILNDTYTVDDLGADTNTIGYEALSMLGHGIRYKRTYLK